MQFSSYSYHAIHYIPMTFHNWKSESESRSVLSDSLRLHRLYSPWNSSGQNTGVGSLFLLQGIFPTQGSNPGLPHCRWILYQLSHSSVQFLSCVWLFATPWTAARQASLSITNSRSPPKPISIESVMPSNHLILCHPLLLLPSIFPSIRLFSNESALHIRWPKYWSFNFNISPCNEHPELTSFRMDWLDLLTREAQRITWTCPGFEPGPLTPEARIIPLDQWTTPARAFSTLLW